MVSVEKNEYNKRKEIEEHTRKGAPVISLLQNVKLRRDDKLGNLPSISPSESSSYEGILPLSDVRHFVGPVAF
jgi:hypothetical protein